VTAIIYFSEQSRVDKRKVLMSPDWIAYTFKRPLPEYSWECYCHNKILNPRFGMGEEDYQKYQDSRPEGVKLLDRFTSSRVSYIETLIERNLKPTHSKLRWFGVPTQQL
jgi:hypothetical protein